MKRNQLCMRQGAAAVCLWVLALAPNAHGLDGRREGFIIGIGIGATPKFHWEGTSESVSQFGESTFGLGVNSMIGYAFDENNLFVIEANGAIAMGGTLPGLTQRMLAPSWYHYFGRVGSSLFTTLGGGIYSSSIEVQNFNGTLDPSRYGSASGLGVLIGGGYEFAGNAQIGLYVSGAALSDGDYDYSGYHVSVLLTGVGY